MYAMINKTKHKITVHFEALQFGLYSQSNF